MSANVIEVPAIDKGIADSDMASANTRLKYAHEIQIVDDPGYEAAAIDRRAIKGLLSDLEAKRKSITKPMDEAKKAAMDLFRPAKEALEAARKLVDGKIVAYAQKKEAERREAERKIEEKRQREEAAEKKRLDDIAERARISAEKAAKEGREEKARELAEKAAENAALAEAVRVEPREVALPVYKPKGLSQKKIWYAEVTDPAEVPRDYLMIDERKLNKMAIAMKGEITIPGVVFKFKTVVAGRG